MYGKLNPWKIGISAAILWGLFIFILTFIAMYTGFAMFWLSQWIDLYPGYEISISGAFIGLAYALVHGFISWALLAWLYNRFRP